MSFDPIAINPGRLLGLDDVLIEPVFSFVKSRKDVDVTTNFLGNKLTLPVLNSNMDTVSSPELCRALADYGMVGTLHRFWSVEENVKAFQASISNGTKPIVSIGIGAEELDRARKLVAAGAEVLMLDVAHAANISALGMYNVLLQEFPQCKFIVGDFGTGREIEEFLNRAGRVPDAVKVGISVGSVCVTRLTTGVGTPAVSCLLDCAPVADEANTKLILDGGVKYFGDVAKALVAGADLVISGSLFAGTDESAGFVINNSDGKFKAYRGSASYESYVVQGKVAPWRAPEGESTLVPYKGPVLNVLNNISGGLRSSCSYVNALNLNELKANARFRYL